MDRIVLFDLETTTSEPADLLEIAALVLDRNTLRIVDSFQTLIRSNRLETGEEIHGITQAMLAEAPEFTDVAPAIMELLEGQVWLGHNVAEFDVPVLTAQFEREGWEPPRASAILDTRQILAESFGMRAGNLKLASLATYLGAGSQRHRAMADVRLTLKVIRRVGAVLLLERFMEKPDDARATAAMAANRLLHLLNRAMYRKTTIWISYGGGAVPFKPRPITPLKWIRFKRLFLAYCHGCKEERHFAFGKVLEIRNERWEL